MHVYLRAVRPIAPYDPSTPLDDIHTRIAFTNIPRSWSRLFDGASRQARTLLASRAYTTLS
eukprot:14759-Eustigmatos_ZCMA.PRE.1